MAFINPFSQSVLKVLTAPPCSTIDSQFIILSINGFASNVIFFRTLDKNARKLYGFNYVKAQASFMLCNDLNHADDVDLFPELNQFRHFLLEFPTIKTQGSPPMNLFGNGSSLEILSSKKSIMGNPGEELQLTGFTTVPAVGKVKDLVNETHYRGTLN